MAYRTRNITFYRSDPGSIPGVRKNNFYTTVYVAKLQEFLGLKPRQLPFFGTILAQKKAIIMQIWIKTTKKDNTGSRY